jgi:small subunit ribosomal protein S4
MIHEAFQEGVSMSRTSAKKAKGKIVRRLGLNIYGNQKYDRLLEKRPTPPGMHTRRRSRLSEYGLQLVEKQKLRFCYGMTERQFRTLFAKAKNMKGITGDNMLVLLERRLDNVVYRMGMASTRSQARQMVKHGHVLLNGHKASTPSQLVSVDDKLTAKDKKSSKEMISDLLEASHRDVPSWLVVDLKACEGMMVRMPEREDIPTVADEQLIVEFYSK